MEKTPQTIYDYIKQEEIAYSLPISLVDGGEWNMKEHVRLSTLYKNSMYRDGKGSVTSLSENDKPFKNIILPILNLQYRAEGFDVKDIEIYVDDPYNYFKSFLVRKYHEKWANENEIDTFIDDMVESYIDFGGALIKEVDDVKPEVVPLQSLAFCDQTDLSGGPIGIKHYFSPDQLMEMAEFGWGNDANGATASLEEIIERSEHSKETNDDRNNKTPGKYVEVYEVQGVLPSKFLDETISEKYVRQTQIVTFIQEVNGQKMGITLFAKKRKNSPFKILLRDKIYGRALGRGGIEELFQSQIWTNYSEIQKKNMLDAASKVIFQTTDAAFANRNKVFDMENGEISILAEGTQLPVTQIDTTPRSLALFEKLTDDWSAHAQMTASANDSIMGENPTSGTPFKLQELVTSESHSLHEYRKGKIATFLQTVYRDWIIPGLGKEITKGQQFMTELSLDEMQYVANAIVQCKVGEMMKEKVLNGEEIHPEEMDEAKELIRSSFSKGGNKRFISILEGEMKDLPLQVSVNIAGKQKNLSLIVDKLTNVFRQIVAAPQVLDDPRMAKLFNQIIEASGLDPIDFYLPESEKPKPQEQPAPPQSQAPNQLPLATNK
jgi:hypothetical protein